MNFDHYTTKAAEAIQGTMQLAGRPTLLTIL
jgi:hypothetical protein